ncbi:MAG: retropepsin-like aspartic protease [Cyanobacteria bacterium P01_F01_bin.53]
MGQLQSAYRLLLLTGFAGWICCACGSLPKQPQGLLTGAVSGDINDVESGTLSVENKAKESIPTKDKTALTEKASAATSAAKGEPASTTPATVGPSAAYREGINLASSAYQLSQSAISPDDWGLVASRWRRAAEQLKKVSPEDEQYPTAQAKRIEYARNAEHATAKVQALQQSVQVPLTRTRPSYDPVSGAEPNTSANPRSVVSSPNRPTSHSNNTTSRTEASSAQAALNRVRVPVVRRLHGTPVVRVTFNDEKIYDMILDTGASRTLITRQMADELGIVATERMLATTASETEVVFDIGRVESIAMGQVTLRDARIGIGESVGVGLLGNDFLRGYDVTIRDREVELVAAE